MGGGGGYSQRLEEGVEVGVEGEAEAKGRDRSDRDSQRTHSLSSSETVQLSSPLVTN